jgi:hypothetical protein
MLLGGRGELAVVATVGDPDIIPSDQRLAVRLEFPQKVSVLIILAQKVDG